MLISSRTLIGLAVGADSAIATAYIAEFAPKGRRGQLSIIQQWMITVGILVSYLIALLVFAVAPGAAKTADWRHHPRRRRGAGGDRRAAACAHAGVPAVADPAGAGSPTRAPRSKKLGVDVTEEEVRRTADVIEKVEADKHDERKRLWTPGRQTRSGRRVCLLRVPADHRHQRAVLLRAAAARRSVQATG